MTLLYNGLMTYIMTGIEGFELTPQDIDHIKNPLTCGVIFFKRNFKDYYQLQQLVKQIRTLRGKNFLLAVDQEGGRVIRFGLPFTQLPPLAQIGGQFDQKAELGHTMAHLHAWLMASELLAIGIDMSFTPVLDIDNGSDVIGDRAFSSDPDVVLSVGQTYCLGMQAAGMKTTGKHYPGHGTVVADSHIALPVDHREQSAIDQLDLKPFKHLIKAGCVDAMMLSHVIYSSVCEQPAGYSARWHQELLRERHGFDGVSISDDLGMKAAECVGDIHQRYQACVEAKIDLTLLCDPKLSVDFFSNNRLKYLPKDSAKLAKIMRLRGESTLRVDQPFWEQFRWQQARKALLKLRLST